MDLKYELTKHPAIRYTVDGGGPLYIHQPKNWFSGKPLFVLGAENFSIKMSINSRKNGPPTGTQRSGSGWERSRNEMNELSPQGGSERYGVCVDDVALKQPETEAKDVVPDALLANGSLLTTLAGDLTISSQDAKNLLAARPDYCNES